jgi:hypothetical protein
MTEQTVSDCRDEIERVLRVSDMLVTGHANLRERYSRRALMLDLAVLAISVWLTAVVFIDPRINIRLTPLRLDPQLWVGLLGVMVLFLSILQLRVDWKGRSDAHKRSFDLYVEVKNECRYLLSSGQTLTRENCQRALTMFELSSDVGCQIPEKEFLKQKRKHLQKVAMSRYLDAHPSASLLLLRLRMWWTSNTGPRKDDRVGG